MIVLSWRRKHGLSIFAFYVVAFCAEIIDDSLGMAYGVSANAFYISMELSPAIASACVHTSEIFITTVSEFSHFKAGNVDFPIFKILVIAGIASEIFFTFAETLTFILTIGPSN